MVEKQGRGLERLIAALTSISNSDSDFKVESPAFLVDKHTGQKREVDVLLTHSYKNHALRIAIECKDHGRPVDVPKVEAFAAKCDSLDVDLSVMVSSSGYYSNCVPKAAAMNVLLHSIEQSVNFDWFRVAGLIEDVAIFGEITITDGRGAVVSDIDFVDAGGQRVLISNIVDCIFPIVIRNPSGLTCEEYRQGHISHEANKFDFKLSPLFRKIPSVDAGIDLGLRVRGIFEFHRIFSTFGHFAHKKTEETLEFAKVKSALIVDDTIATILITELSPNRLHVLGGSNCGSSNTRIFRRLVSWDVVTERLLECGPRHHFKISAKSDTLTASAFTHDFDEGVGTWSGQDSWPDLIEDGASTVSAYDKYEKKWAGGGN